MSHSNKAGDLLSGLEFFSIKLGLEQSRRLFALAGNPDSKLKFIHVAGSNGKGSVCTLLDSALRKAGFKTGFYSSPHLVDVRERFRVNGRIPSPSAYGRLLEEAGECLEALRKEGGTPTYFEATTLMAALLFAKEKTDFVIWETGLGGRLDATNIIAPLCSVISSISMEHADRLGGTLGQIAFEKAGIIKPGRPVFCAKLQPEAQEVVKRRAEELGSELLMPSSGIGAAQASFGADGSPRQSFSIDGRRIELSLPGPCQRRNAALCLKVLEWLSPRFGFKLDDALAGFATAKWPARLQFIPERNCVIDGAHNPEAAQELVSTIKELLPGERLQIIAGSFSDKDSAAVLRPLTEIASEFIFVHLDTGRPSRTPEEMSQLLCELGYGCIPHRGAANVAEALSLELGHGAIRRLVCGSLHLCGDALAALGRSDDATDLA